jgi:hypothetical protein
MHPTAVLIPFTPPRAVRSGALSLTITISREEFMVTTVARERKTLTAMLSAHPRCLG